jgi:endoglucanase
MIDPRSLTEADYRVLGGEWKANLVRWCFHGAPNYASVADDAAYDKWLDGEIKRLDAMLPVLRKYGIYAVVAMFGVPGGGTGWDGSPLYTNSACQRKIVDVWKKLAKHYKGVEGIFGYDPVNEPMDVLGIDNVGYDTVPGSVYNWWELSDRISRAIREIDADRLILIEPTLCIPYAFNRYIPLNIPNIVYSPHMYMPYQFTHQFVFPCFDKKLRYPGFEWGGQIWDRNRIRAELGHVVTFQQKWGARIYVGEFSAIRWAPGACEYLKDVTDVFEENDWDWTYHAFREFLGWSVELSEDKDKPVQKVTDRQKLLRELFSKNKKEVPAAGSKE